MLKRRKLQSSRPIRLPVLECSAPQNLQVLVSVRVVCRHRPELLHLPHVVASLHSCLDWSREVPFIRVCGSNFVYLVRRRLAEFNLQPEDSLIRNSDFRQWQFSEGVTKAVDNDNLELVELLSTHFISCYVPNEAIILAASRNKLEILQWLVAHRNETRWDGEVVAAAIARDHFALAKWLVERLGTTSVHELGRWAEAAAKTGNLEMLKWVCSFSEEVNLLSGLWSAVDEGQLEVVKWILQQLDDEILTSPDFGFINLNKACLAQHLAVVKWLVHFAPTKCFVTFADVQAAKRGNFDVVRLLHANNIRGCSRTAITIAASRGHLDTVKWLIRCEDQSSEPDQTAMGRAAVNGHLDIVKWLHDNTFQRCAAYDMDYVAEAGNLEMLQWFHDNQTAGCTSSAMDLAASKGHLDVVKWLHTNQSEGCTTHAMDFAAAHGFLDVVKWLHHNRTEGCTVDAMNKAAKHGHLDVLKWLHENRTEGCTTDAMDGAARNGHLDVVKWLDANRTEGCTTSAMDGAATNQNGDVVEWLHCNRSEGGTAATMGSFAAQGDIEAVYWCRYIGPGHCDYSVIQGAVQNGHFEIAWFLHQDRKWNHCDVIRAVRECFNPIRRWEFTEWLFLHHRKEFHKVADDLFSE